MNKKQMEEKRKEFYKFAFHTAICDKFLNPDSEECQCGLDDIWQWIEKLIEEVEESLSQNSDFLLKATRDLEQKSCNHMTNLEYYDGTIQCTRCYKFLTGKEYIKVLNNCGIGN